jgi:transposase-like protein
MKKRRRFTADLKVKILREHLDNQIMISELAERYAIHPTVILRWKKELFEGALTTFSQEHKKRKGKTRKEERQEQKIQKMKEVITDLSTENLQLRKKYNGEI